MTFKEFALKTAENFNYQKMDEEERPFALRLGQWIAQNLQAKKVTDLGAGTGVYVEELRRLGVAAQGYDIADPQPRPDLVQKRTMFGVQDPADVVVCLEVAEHVLSHLAELVIASCWRNVKPGGYCVFSAAQPGQGGVGHINCRYPEYWRNLAREAGFVLVPNQEQQMLRDIRAGYHMGWFANNGQLWHRPHDSVA